MENGYDGSNNYELTNGPRWRLVRRNLFLIPKCTKISKYLMCITGLTHRHFQDSQENLFKNKNQNARYTLGLEETRNNFNCFLQSNCWIFVRIQ